MVVRPNQRGGSLVSISKKSRRTAASRPRGALGRAPRSLLSVPASRRAWTRAASIRCRYGPFGPQIGHWTDLTGDAGRASPPTLADALAFADGRGSGW